MTDSDFRMEDGMDAVKPNYTLRRIVMGLLVSSAVFCLWVLFGTVACRHPLEHVAAGFWMFVCVPSIAVAWLDHLHPEMWERVAEALGL